MPMKTKEEQRQYQLAWMHKRRQDWIDSQGGKCACGSVDRLEVDHIDIKLKTMNPTQIWSRRQEVRDKELANCQVLCYECHKKKTLKQITSHLTHGTLGFYAKGCKCRPCLDAHNDYNRAWKAKNKEK